MADFASYHVLGNDYLVVDRADFPRTADAARLVCDRRRGVGADGVLLPTWVDGVPAVRIFNADGSECGRSGNGLIILARHLREAGVVPSGHLTVRTATGPADVWIGDDLSVQVSLGPFRARDPQRLDVDATVVDVTTVDIGTPHCVAFGSPSAARRLGPLLVAYPGFEQRHNVEFVAVPGRDTLDAEVWERGAGYTPASGAGAAAAAVAARVRGLVDPVVSVRMPGGTVRVEVADEVRLTGRASATAVGQLAADLLADLGVARHA
ncbi:diaminopimelate epimerase [Micromonospora sp. WMMD1120]|uniref:diaminopimelate epimerase n=1 Tax=Micromonospora sp. WMMD1120 TaxID=3016106 RepID=UPI002415EE2C|nr:diaminopimelate epimerase [Micromonospora sp. WMMD1120]MDG4807541.1 diaminopimelate epimerase [Micromonospora sp. WMMD1120]